jgi:hypothetical protein
MKQDLARSQYLLGFEHCFCIHYIIHMELIKTNPLIRLRTKMKGAQDVSGHCQGSCCNCLAGVLSTHHNSSPDLISD